ncbi:conserved hypothetical protein [Aeromonas veronii]|uniref:HNH endonuclease n=1 Tax=Aeromonas veronii TaxID=654 RepID=A0A653KX46_AERVE|nr:hypothetical protein [Aeromonas veronii]VXA83620.1 conserved hypothetical protein [Aeromonas veronii]
MIKQSPKNLQAAQVTYLSAEQLTINVYANYTDRVSEANTSWGSKSAAHFKKIRSVLESMNPGLNRCCYCEDSVADEVEHVRPKNLYPELTFVWDNFLYVCGQCNTIKKNKYAVVDQNNNHVVVTRMKKDPKIAPVIGGDGFVNPRKVDPLDYMYLDFSTMQYLPCYGLSVSDHEIAEFTINILKLNQRDILVEGRKVARKAFFALANEYAAAAQAGDQNEMNLCANSIKKSQFSTVWAEMKRQRANYAKLQAIFNAAPGLLTI